jgi:hypothetical protein
VEEKDCSPGKDFVGVLAYVVERSTMADDSIVPEYEQTGVFSGPGESLETEGH